MLESFDFSFMLLRGFATSERPEIPALAVLLVLGVQTVTLRSELANHSRTYLLLLLTGRFLYSRSRYL